MAKLKFEGLDKYILYLEKISNDVDKITGKAMYQGAKIVADDLKNTLNGLPTDDSRNRDMRTGLRSIEKAGLIHGMGISHTRRRGADKNVSIGFHDYNKLGKPNRMIAGALENGTSFMRPTRAISKSYRKSKSKAEAKMIEVLDSEIKKIIQ